MKKPSGVSGLENLRAARLDSANDTSRGREVLLQHGRAKEPNPLPNL